MPLPKQKFRELIVQLLYCKDFSLGEELALVEFSMEQLKTTKSHVCEAFQYLQKICDQKSFLDEKLKELPNAYEFERISPVELNILRLAAFELFFEKEVPTKVVFAEAIRLCRKFGTPESARFVNALLSTLHKKQALVLAYGNPQKD
jgi:transcription antitermination protein NusB